MTSAPSPRPVSVLRARMIEDMTVRGFTEETHSNYIRHVRSFAAFMPPRSHERGQQRTRLMSTPDAFMQEINAQKVSAPLRVREGVAYPAGEPSAARYLVAIVQMHRMLLTQGLETGRLAPHTGGDGPASRLGDAAGARVKRAGSSTYQARPRAPFARGPGRADRRGGSRYRARSGRRAPRFGDGHAGACANHERPPGLFRRVGSRAAADAKPVANLRAGPASGLPSYENS